MKARNGIIKTMKAHKTVSLLVAALVVVGGVGTAVAFYPEPEPERAVVEQAASQEAQEEPVEAIVEQEPAPEPVEQEEAPVEEPEQLKYGESVPGIYKVFDTEWAINEAGIPNDQQDAAAELISKLSGGWVYRNTTNVDDANLKNLNLCRAYPKTKMSVSGSDYETNPVTQIKWCNYYVENRYGSWQRANEFWQEQGYF